MAQVEKNRFHICVHVCSSHLPISTLVHGHSSSQNVWIMFHTSHLFSRASRDRLSIFRETGDAGTNFIFHEYRGGERKRISRFSFWPQLGPAFFPVSSLSNLTFMIPHFHATIFWEKDMHNTRWRKRTLNMHARWGRDYPRAHSQSTYQSLYPTKNIQGKN